MFDVVIIPAANSHESFTGVYSSVPNIGVEFLNKYLRSNGISSTIIYPKIKDGRPHYNILGLEPRVIGLSGTSKHFKNIIELSDLLKKQYPETKIIVGGYVSYMQEELLKHDSIDAVCKGEGEQTLLDYSKMIINNKPTKRIQGLYQRGEDYIPRTEYLDINQIPLPSFKELDLDEDGVISTARGCTYGKCTFCESKDFNPAPRVMTAETVIKWVEKIIKQQPINGFEVYDNNFLNSKVRAEKILEYFNEKGLKIGFLTRADSIINCKELLAQYQNVIGSVGVGIESFSQSQLDRWCKGTTVETNIEALQLMHDLKIYADSFIIISDQYTTINEIEDSLDTILNKAPSPVYKGLELPFALVSLDLNTITNNRNEALIKDIPYLWEPQKFLLNTRLYIYTLLQTTVGFHNAGVEKSTNSLIDLSKNLTEKRIGIYFLGVKSIKENDANGIKIFNELIENYTKKAVRLIEKIRDTNDNLEKFITYTINNGNRMYKIRDL